MNVWPSTQAKAVLAALVLQGWRVKRQTGSHRVLTKPGWNHLEVRTLRGVLSYLEKPPRALARDATCARAAAFAQLTYNAPRSILALPTQPGALAAYLQRAPGGTARTPPSNEEEQ